MVINALGDSIVNGYGVEDNCSFISRENSALNIKNYGINGDTTDGILKRIKSHINAEYILIFIGINDFLNGKSVDYVFKNICRIIDLLEKKDKNIILCIPFKLEESLYDFSIKSTNYKIIELRELILSNMKRRKILIVDFYKELLKEDNYSKLFIDGIHPNKKAHSLMGNILYKVLRDGKWIE